MDDHPDDEKLYRVGVCMDSLTLRPVRAMLAWDKPFSQTHATDEMSAKNASAVSVFSKCYPHKEP